MNSGEFIVLNLVMLTERGTQFEWRMKDSWSREKCLRELDLNIILYLTLNYVTALEHLKYSARKLYSCFMCLWLLWGLTITQY